MKESVINMSSTTYSYRTKEINMSQTLTIKSLISQTNNVLLLEDISENRDVVRWSLETMGFKVYDTPSSVEAKEIFGQHDFLLSVLHLKHDPVGSLKVCRWIKAESTVPVIMLTHREETLNEEMAMFAGADDYVLIPINSKVLVSRISQQIKRRQTQHELNTKVLSWGSLRLDPSRRIFTINDNDCLLTKMEYLFIQLLMESPQRIFSRKQILDAIGVRKGIGTDHIVDSHASRIRAKIRVYGGPEVISAIRSVGFRLI
jgi:two-component system response regulator RegX3